MLLRLRSVYVQSRAATAHRNVANHECVLSLSPLLNNLYCDVLHTRRFSYVCYLLQGSLFITLLPLHIDVL